MEGNIYINGEIGETVNLVDIISQVENQKEATMFNVYINSVGGSVDVGFDIYNYIKSLNVPIKTIGQELVASIATVIFMVGNERVLEQGTEFMIHLPWGSVSGTSNEIEQYNEMLKKYEKKLVDFYTKATNLSEEAIRPLLTYETWLSPKLANDLKFTTSIASDLPVLAKANFNFKPDNKMTEEQKGFFANVLDKLDTIMGKISGSSNVKAILLQDANGVEIEFPEVMEGELPEVGVSIATVDGTPAEGEYIMPDGQTYIFVGGVLTDIKEVEADETSEEIEDLKRQLAEAQSQIEAKDLQITEIANEVKAMKKEIKSSFKAEPIVAKKDDDKQVSEASKALENLKQKRRK